MSKAKTITAARKFAAGEEGAALVEYGLLIGLIACICIGVLTAVGGNIKGIFGSVNTTIDGANTAVNTGS